MPPIITGYPQMPPLTQEELEAFLSQPLIAKLATLNEDGTIHIAPIYFKYENGEFTLGTQAITRKVRNVRRNPNVTLLIDQSASPFKGVLVYGKATLEHENVIQKRTVIFEKTRPTEAAREFAEGLASKWKPIIIRVKPDRMVSFDYSKASFI